jgi:simple sugar transport system permease protein
MHNVSGGLMENALRTRGIPIAGSLALSAVLVALLLAACGADPLATASALWRGALGSPYTIGQTLTIATVLALTGLAACLPFTAKLWNVGAEGQLYAGGTASVLVGLSLPDALPGPAVAVLATVAGALGGALWAAVPGLLAAFVGASEMIVSLLLNFVATTAASYVITSVVPDSSGQGTQRLPRDARLLTLWPAGGVTVALVIAVVAVLLAAFVLRWTRFGFSVRAVGLGRDSARLAGFSTRSVTVSTFAIGGAAAGLAGAALVLGSAGQMTLGMSANYGFIGVAVALVAGLRPLPILLSAVVFAALSVGSNNLQVAVGLPKDLGSVLVAVLVLALLATHVIRLRREGSR